MVKRYFAETGSEAVTELWSSASLIVASQLLYAEMIATFARKLREEPNRADTIARMQKLVELATDGLSLQGATRFEPERQA